MEFVSVVAVGFVVLVSMGWAIFGSSFKDSLRERHFWDE